MYSVCVKKRSNVIGRIGRGMLKNKYLSVGLCPYVYVLVWMFIYVCVTRRSANGDGAQDMTP